MFNILTDYLIKPDLYAPSIGKFWDDEHISKGMFEAHLNPDWNGATRKHDFVNKSVKRIASIAHTTQFQQLLDLGCGPLSIMDRLILLRKVYQALKPNGKFIFDVFTPLMRKAESRSWYYSEESGFWKEEPHI